MMKRAFWDNIVPIRPELAAPVEPSPPSKAWWERARNQLDWQPIASYERLDGDLGLATPVVLREGEIWHFGAWIGREWREVTEGASWPLDGFEPTEWAEPSMTDFIILHRE